jgi:receptor protein-tyrosine kinase
VKECQAQIGELEAALERGRAHALERIRNQYLSAQQREKLLSDDYNRQFRVVTEQSQGAVRYNMLKREVDTNRQLYTAMLQKVKEAGIASEMRASNVQVIDPATRPGDPVRPNLPLYGAVGLLTGVLSGIGRAVYRKRTFVIQAPGDASIHLKLPELGAIPQGDSNGVSPLTLTGVFAFCRNGSHEVLAGDAAADSETLELASWRHKESVIAESFRATLASVRFSERSGRGPLAVAVTSACPAEGKTVVATNLAIVLAETGRRVLLMDGDLRRPRLHDIFRIPNTSGFADLLRGSGTQVALSASLAIRTEVPGLYVLPSGPDSASAANLLQSDSAAEVLHRLRQQFDAVVIDTPPLSVADPRILGQLADGVVLVIRADRTLPDVAFAASRQLLEDGASVLGTILNGWNPKKISHHNTYRRWQHTYSNYMPTCEKR